MAADKRIVEILAQHDIINDKELFEVGFHGKHDDLWVGFTSEDSRYTIGEKLMGFIDSIFKMKSKESDDSGEEEWQKLKKKEESKLGNCS